MSDPADLLPQVYDELRKLAAAKLAGENPGHTLDATALVHEAWLRLADASIQWQDRSHFLRRRPRPCAASLLIAPRQAL